MEGKAAKPPAELTLRMSPSLLLAKDRRNRAYDVHDPEQIDIKVVLDALLGDRFEYPILTVPGVIDHHIELPEALDRVPDRLVDAGGICYVQPAHQHVVASGQFLGG
jgi:hypothetical protein